MEEKTILLSDLLNYRLVSKENWEKIVDHVRKLSLERNLWKEYYEELKKRYTTLFDDHHKLLSRLYGYMQVVEDHAIDSKEVLVAIEEYEKGVKHAKVKLDPDEERDLYEDDYPGWGSMFERAAQKSNCKENTKKTKE